MPGAATALQHQSAAPEARRRERRRRHLVAVVMVLYLLVIAEGSIRKWLLPEYSQVLFFIRDPVLLYAYLYAARHGLWPSRSGWLQLAWAMAVLGVVLVAVQAAVGGASDTRLLLGVYGWRSYFLYLPLVFLVGAQFEPADLRRLLRWTLVLALPVAVLVAWQFSSPIDAPINVGSASEVGQQFRGVGLNAERTRPMGPFSSGAGQQQFVASACALLLAAFIAQPTARLAPRWLLPLAAAALGTCLALSGSRGTVLQSGLCLAFALALVVVGRGTGVKLRAVVWPLSLAAAGVILYPVVYPEGFASFVERWTTAAEVESGFTGGIFGRALFGFVDFVRLIDQVPALGYGLGYGGNASILLRAQVDGIEPGKLAETDFARHMVDLGPALGMAFIAFRVCLTGWLLRRVWRATRHTPDPLPMMLFGYVAYVLLLGQITGQGAINFYGWLFTGLCIAATRHAGVAASRTARRRAEPSRLRQTMAVRPAAVAQ